MPSRLAVLCDKLLEAGWLAALIIAPLFFNVYSSRVFEPDKIALVRSLALMMSVAWLVKQIEIGALSATSMRAAMRENPLIVPMLGVAAINLLATIFSVVPDVSFWGSYQRLQGAYSTLAYITIFLVAANALRSRAQFERAINTIIVASFPIAFYGLLQHYQLDPLPWGGDTVIRVASNLGNSIFVAAYLIMVAPLTMVRLFKSPPPPARGWFILLSLALLALTILWAIDFSIGAIFAAALMLGSILYARAIKANPRDALLSATHAVILAAQLVTIFFSQSRGPWLGLAGGLFAFAMVYALMRGARRFVLGALALAAIVVAFLAIFNLPGSPLEPLKRVPYVGRLGQILDPESATGKVRELIWQGALQIVLPHAPLWSPTTGDDALNLIRPLIGYGPEAMYVAYNPFYQPELAHLEARNASPDRAHNETFDALVTTGVFGFAAANLLFLAVFYFALKWLGLIASRAQRNALILLWYAGGALSALGFGLWRGWHFIGVALPAGMIAGLFVFLIARAFRRAEPPDGDATRARWLSALFAIFIAHFIEIHFGIAIVSTRVYFWFCAALLFVIGMNRLTESATEKEGSPEPTRQPARQKKKRGANPAPVSKGNAPLAPVMIWTIITTLVLSTLTYEFINNQSGSESPLNAVRQSLWSKPDGSASAVYLLFAFTWLIAGIIGLSDQLRAGARALPLALFIAVSLTVQVWLTLLQARALTQPGDLTAAFLNILTEYYFALFLLVIVLTIALAWEKPRPRVWMHGAFNAFALPLSAIALPFLIYSTNFAPVAADILYKTGSNYDSLGAWDQSIAAYGKARDLQPAQDYYALFMGRAYLEKARATTDTNQRAGFLKQSEQVLQQAQQLNPLNTDHSANLARLQRIWATLVTDANDQAAHQQQSAAYYAAATRLSPNTAYLRNEWSQTYSQSGDWANMRAQLEQSLQIDPQYAQTYFLLGEYYRAQDDAPHAADQYFKALALDPYSLSDPDGTPLAGPISIFAQPEIAPRALETYRARITANAQLTPPYYALAEIYQRGGDLQKAQAILEQVAQVAPTDLTANLQLVNFYSESGQIPAALTAMRRVLDLIPPSRANDVARFQQFFTQLQTLNTAIQAAQKSPNDVTPHRTLAALWKNRGQPQFALAEYQTLAQLAPNDYDARKNLALLNLQLLQLDDAERALASAVAIAPEVEKPMLQNIQMAINDHKLKLYDRALKSAQAALALATPADKPVVQAYIEKLLELIK